MEVLGVFGIDWRLLGFQILNFLLLLWLLRRFLYRPVLKIIEERRFKAEEGVRNAEHASHMLKAASEQVAVEKAAALRKADELIEEGKRHAEEKRQMILGEADKEKKAIVASGADEAALLKKKALDESSDEITRLAVLAAEKILKQS